MQTSLDRLLTAIKLDPFISQQQLAEQLGVSRSTIASQIAELTKAGKLLGRAYVLAEQRQVVCIGGANQDRKLQLQGKFIPGSSLPVSSSSVSAGGVARNVAENLARLKVSASLCSVVGDDLSGKWLLEHCQSAGINTELCQIKSGHSSGQYAAVLDQQHELAVALAEMGIFDTMDLTWLVQIWPRLRQASYILADCNLRQDVLQELLKLCAEQRIPVAVDPVSATKAERLKGNLSLIRLMTPNREEALILTGLDDCVSNETLAQSLHHQGVEQVALTLGKDGVILVDETGITRQAAFPVEVADVTGAGDALLAGMIAASMDGGDLRQAAQWGQAAAAITLADRRSVSPELTQQAVTDKVAAHTTTLKQTTK